MKIKYSMFRERAAVLLADGRPRHVTQIIKSIETKMRILPTRTQASAVLRCDPRFISHETALWTLTHLPSV